MYYYTSSSLSQLSQAGANKPDQISGMDKLCLVVKCLGHKVCSHVLRFAIFERNCRVVINDLVKPIMGDLMCSTHMSDIGVLARKHDRDCSRIVFIKA